MRSEHEILAHYREIKQEMQALAKQIDCKRAQIEKLEREIKPLQQRVNFLVRIPHE